MTPEWSRRAGLVLDSPYWNTETATTKEEFDEWLKQQETELWPLQEAVREVDKYEDLNPEIKEIFDRAEKVALDAQAKHKEFVENDVEGFGRFLTEL